MGRLPFLLSYQQVQVFDVRTRSEQLFDQRFPQEAGAAGNEDGRIAIELLHRRADFASRNHLRLVEVELAQHFVRIFGELGRDEGTDDGVW